MSGIDKYAVLEEHESTFGDDFIHDVDSWFSADIACCDECYDDFLECWPLAEQSEFDSSCMDLRAFYDGSKRCRANYTEEEFHILLSTVSCPRCGSPLSGNIWPYTLPFAYKFDPIDLEMDMYEISKIAEVTPFLLLTNDFASNVLELLKKLASKTGETKIDHSLYRARVASQISRLKYDEFFVAPHKFISEGRYNHAGQQTLYLASDMDTCYQEVGATLCYAAEIKLTRGLKILDLVDSEESHGDSAEDLYALVFSSLMSRPLDTDGYHKPCYVFSRFVADCARLAGFDAIKYPSTKMTRNNYNLVILNPTDLKKAVSYKSLYLKDQSNEHPLDADYT